MTHNTSPMLPGLPPFNADRYSHSRGYRPALAMIAFFSALLITASVELHAQYGVRFGPEISYGFGQPLSLNRTLGTVQWCMCDGRGTSLSHAIWGGGELTGLFNSSPDIAARVKVGRTWDHFSSDPYVIPFSPGTSLSGQRGRFVVQNNNWYLAAEMAFVWRLRSLLSLELGASLMYRIAGTYSHYEELIEPAGDVFSSTGTSQRPMDGGNELSGARLRPGILTGVAFSLPLDSTLLLVPSLRIRTDLELLQQKARGPRAFSVAAGVALHFVMQGTPPPIPPLDTLDDMGALDYVTKPGTFKASIDIYARDSTGAQVQQFVARSRYARYRRVAPLVPIVFFDNKSVSLLSPYIHLAPEQADRFTVDSLARLDAAGLHAHTLNITALRLRAHPGARLILSSPAGEPHGLNMARIEAVRDYLVDVWRIPPERITVGGGTTMPPTNTPYAAVQVSFDNADTSAMLLPVLTDWEEQELETPQIGVRPRFKGGTGIRQWSISVRHLGREVLHCTSDGVQERRDLDVNLRGGSSEHNTNLPPLVAELVAEDSAGTLTVARDHLPVVLDAAVRSAYIQATYTVPVHNGRIDRTMLQVAAARVRTTDRVVITYRDNRAQHAAEEIAAVLRTQARNVAVEPPVSESGTIRPALLEAAYGTPVTVIVEHDLKSVSD